MELIYRIDIWCITYIPLNTMLELNSENIAELVPVIL